MTISQMRKNQWPFILHLLFDEEGLMESQSCRIKCQLPLYDGICAAYLMACFAWLKPSSTLYCLALLCIFILLVTVLSRRDKIEETLFFLYIPSQPAASLPLPSKSPEQSCHVCEVSRNFRIMIRRDFSDAFSHKIPAIFLKKGKKNPHHHHQTKNPKKANHHQILSISWFTWCYTGGRGKKMRIPFIKTCILCTCAGILSFFFFFEKGNKISTNK